MRFRHLDTSVRKTLSFAVIHLAIAVTLGWLLTGSFILAGLIALIEPTLNTFTHFQLDRLWARRGARVPLVARSAVFGAAHLAIAVTVGWIVTGSLVVASAMAVIEPLVNSVAHYFFERRWQRREAARRLPADVGLVAA